jgi:hypothetical protein
LEKIHSRKVFIFQQNLTRYRLVVCKYSNSRSTFKACRIRGTQLQSKK